MKKELQSILSSDTENCIIKSNITDKFAKTSSLQNASSPEAENTISGSIQDISKEQALKRLGNRQDLYDKYYKRFIDGYADASYRIRQLLASGSYEEAYRLAHSIKGLAGTLGLAEVYISSSRLCSALKVDQTSGGQYLNELEVSLNRLLP